MKILIGLVVLLLGIQFIPVTKDNPHFDKTKEIKTSQEVKQVLKKACYDCHSFETKYSLYSKVAPLSWGVRKHIVDGRRALNFSIWEDIPEDIKKMRVQKMFSEVRHGFMPLPSYLMFHKEARLSKDEVQILQKWVDKDLKPKYDS